MSLGLKTIFKLSQSIRRSSTLVYVRNCGCTKNCVRGISSVRRRQRSESVGSERLEPDFDNSTEIKASTTPLSPVDIRDPAHRERLNELSALFPNKEIKTLAARCPQVFYQDFSEIEHIAQYISAKMGLEQDDMVRAGVFDYPLEHIVKRHIFITRCGGFKKVKDRTRKSLSMVNPSLRDIVRTSDAEFARLAQVTVEEYAVFCDMFAAQRRNLVDYITEGRISALVADQAEDELDDEDNDEEDDEQHQPGRETLKKKRR
ncbi:transcription termination factor 4, mitochondrial-like [Paramacrobiotus metropolitanus]|uniref:transcription termination factor 4, mitochondrial-like n=1 Tax=Paramacrobiotus metropolitanus TaxID=2943436 RepID=UPI0024456ED2|nr:transcription termination factor 4, mitochondrial-like [Paramacrobiotus metropolitanus]